MGVWIEITVIWKRIRNVTSLPLWECGLKLLFLLLSYSLARVTPLVGVWIEIRNISVIDPTKAVTPLVGVWIEISALKVVVTVLEVTPLVGVWIEIFLASSTSPGISVTPLVGVWIEIPNLSAFNNASSSHSPCGSVD